MLTFAPIFKELIWGGANILPFKGLPPDNRMIGESWELAHLEQGVSVVANGELTGKTIAELIQIYGSQLLGSKVYNQYGNTFPLLIKFIDAREKLSIQVHPNDRLAQERHQLSGKTEMWYIVKATSDAAIFCGFAQPIDADEYVHRVINNSLMEVLQRYRVKAGDVFFLPAGRIHAIDAGCLIAEIQQTSNITYRIYDYNRRDSNGNLRELHTELAKDAIDFSFCPDYKTTYHVIENEAIPLVQCPYFTTNLLKLNQPIKRDFSMLDSFVIYICTKGVAILKDNYGFTLNVRQGQTILIPADTLSVTIEPTMSSDFLETFILNR